MKSKDKQFIWSDGKIVPFEDAKVHILVHALHYGSAVFEGIRAYKTEAGGVVFKLGEHIDRLFYSADVLGMKVPFSKKDISSAVLELLSKNLLDEAYIRPIIFYSRMPLGLNPEHGSVSVAIATWKWGAYLGDVEAVKIKTSKFIRIHPNSTVVDAKISGHYVNAILATQEAREAGYDEALMLDYEGYVAEGPGENIFMVKDGKLYTPEEGTILKGITRDAIISLAEDIGLSALEKKITPEELKSADEVFFTGTAVEVAAVGIIDDKTIGDGKAGDITKKLQELFGSVVHGQEPKYSGWLTPLSSKTP